MEMWQERAAWSERMARPNRRYVTSSQAQSDGARKLSAEIAHEMKLEEMRVLDYIRRAQTADLQGKVDEAKRAIIRVKKQAIAKQKMCEGSAKAKQSVFEQKKDLYLDSVQEVKKCLILAPRPAWWSTTCRKTPGAARPSRGWWPWAKRSRKVRRCSASPTCRRWWSMPRSTRPYSPRSKRGQTSGNPLVSPASTWWRCTIPWRGSPLRRPSMSTAPTIPGRCARWSRS